MCVALIFLSTFRIRDEFFRLKFFVPNHLFVGISNRATCTNVHPLHRLLASFLQGRFCCQIESMRSTLLCSISLLSGYRYGHVLMIKQWQINLNWHQGWEWYPWKKCVNRDKCSVSRMFGVSATDEILRYRWSPFAAFRTLCHPDLYQSVFIVFLRALFKDDFIVQLENMRALKFAF